MKDGGLGNMISEPGSANIENYKIVILGDQFVGKTSILHKFRYEHIEEQYAVWKVVKLSSLLSESIFLQNPCFWKTKLWGWYSGTLQEVKDSKV